jgi:hypothetical protein
MGRESLAERCLHCVTFPSPEFEIQARAFACAAFMMRRVYIEPDPDQGGWAIVLQQPEERIEQEESRVEHDAVFLTSTTSSAYGSSDEEAEASLKDGGSMLLPPQEQFGGKPYFPNSLSSLPPRAGALRTALFPDRANWHTTQSRLEMKQRDPLAYEAIRPKLRQIVPLPASLTSPMRKKKKEKEKAQTTKQGILGNALRQRRVRQWEHCFCQTKKQTQIQKKTIAGSCRARGENDNRRRTEQRDAQRTTFRSQACFSQPSERSQHIRRAPNNVVERCGYD